MAATQYQIFCRYYHSSVNRSVINESEVKWVQAGDRPSPRLAKNDSQCVSFYDGVSCEENLWIRHEDWLQTNVKQEHGSHARDNDITNKKKAARDLDSSLSALITQEANISNPKFDMIFVYEGIASEEGAPPTNVSYCENSYNAQSYDIDPEGTNPPPVVYYEKMARFIMSPWFVYATGSSLTWAIRKAEELINIIGKENVIIGKVVDLTQYIEIV